MKRIFASALVLFVFVCISCPVNLCAAEAAKEDVANDSAPQKQVVKTDKPIADNSQSTTLTSAKPVARPAEKTSDTQEKPKLADRLVSTIMVDYQETELGDVLQELSHIAGVNIIIAPGVQRDMPVTLILRDTTPKKALEWVMELTGYHYTIRDEAVFVSDKKDSKVELRIYPVADLVNPPRDYHVPASLGEDGGVEDDLPAEDKAERREKFVEVIRNLVDANTR